MDWADTGFVEAVQAAMGQQPSKMGYLTFLFCEFETL
jgi:hypothetical protein